MIPRIVGQLMAVAMVAMLGWIGWQWFQINGHKAQAFLLKSQLLEAQGELAVQKANAATLRGQIQRQNDAVDEAAREAARVRAAALRARDAALADLKEAEADYATLRKDWPQDCVAAVERVRERRGL
tara:strand:- start:111 stop:491 length:381 start_codon:yes stop_codon:yes gene_type:complete